MQLAKVTPLNAKNPIPVYGVETKIKETELKETKVKKDTSAKAKSKPKAVKAKAKKPSMDADLSYQIAMCAYYKAESRGFAPGFEMEDWLAAEAEIKNAHC